MFESAVFEQIQRTWLSRQSNAPVPSIDVLRALVETAFVASLKREEGALSRSSIILHGGESVPGGVCETLIFETPLPLTPEALTKLGAACVAQSTALGVRQTSTVPASFEIWGLVYMRSPMQVFEDLSAIHEFSVNQIESLTVTVMSPASLLVSCGGAQIGRFLLGEFIPARPTPLISRAMGGYVMRACPSPGPPYEYWNLYRDSLEYLFLSASHEGHGGTIIVLPSDLRVDYKGLVTPRYRCSGQMRIGTLIRRIIDYKAKDSLFDASYRRALAERLRAVAKLTCIDGALLVSNQLEPIAFGVTLQAPTWAGSVVVGPDAAGVGGQPFDVSRLGTRHNSAVNFIGACPGSYGFVISQDGPIRGFVSKDEGTLYCWPDCTASVFA